MSPLQKDPQGRPFVPLFINGQPLPLTDSSRLYPVHSALSTSSSSNEPIHYYASASLSDCAQACEAAWSAFNGTTSPTTTTSSSSADGAWKRSTVTTRRSLILRAADLLETRQAELIDAQIRETSCQRTWAQTNISLTVGYMREIAARISSVLAGEIPTMEQGGTFAFVFREPVGPVLVIPPWNAAVVLAMRGVTSAVAAGCTVVLKASELCPLTHGLIVEVFRQAGLPPGVLNSVQSVRGEAEAVTEGLVGDERIRKVEFIGSAAVGRKVAGLAAKYLKPVLMELGGKCPAIVLDDADLEKAAMLCAKGAVMHHGQICFSTERIIVLQSVAQRFQDLLVKAVANEPGGTAVHSGIAEKAQSILQDAKDHGNEFLVGGPEMAVENGLKPSIVLVDPKTNKDDLKIVDEETFGPSASLYVVEDDAEAIQLANRSAYGLNATIHSNNMERALKMGRELEYGQVHVNSITVFTSWTGPQGGVKGSGWGRQNARWGMEEFLQEKFITYHGKDSG